MSAGGATPVIIEAAINGVTDKTTNPHVPLTPEEISEDALACFEAGAAIVHNHIDLAGVDAETAADRYLEGWIPVLRQWPGAILYPTSNFGPTVAESYGHMGPLADRGGLRIGIADPGSVNIGSIVYTNSRRDINYQFDLCRRLGIGPSIAIFEPGFLREAVARWRDGTIPAGAMIKLYLCGDRAYAGKARFGLPPTEQALQMYVSLLEDCDIPWSVAAIGGDVVTTGLAAAAVDLGGHLHVGLEDYGGTDTPTNRELVEAAVAIVEKSGRPRAGSDDVVRLLKLPTTAPAPT